jgi:uncharacterized protein
MREGMRLSAFNLYVENYPEADDTLIHNTFTGAYVVLPATEVEILRRAERGEPLAADEQAIAADAELRDPDVGILVESRREEEQEFRAWFEARRSRRRLEAILSINLACNFDCPYCCQAEVMSGKVMSKEHADATAAWLAAHAREHEIELVSLVFCGGEPLLHPERIKRIARQVRDALAGTGIEVELALITNGYFLTEELVSELLPLGLARAQVTLDGDETTHSLTRVSKKGEDTFARIFENVKQASRRIRVAINGNYQDNTVHGFGPLIRKLAEAKLSSQTSLLFSPALQVLAAPEGSASGACTRSGSDTALEVALRDEVWRHGFQASLPHQIGPCEFFDRHAFAIDPDGIIFKCPGFLGYPEWGIGHVTSGLTERYGRMVNQNPQRLCGSCEHKPNCAGGCVAAQWTELGRPEGISCEKAYLDRVKDESVVRGYLLATSETRAEAVAAFPEPSATLPTQPLQRGHKPPALRVVA